MVALALAALIVAVVLLMVRARRRGRAERPVREPSAIVVLDANLWDDCTVDDVREPWARLATEPIRGFCGVASGRHRVRTVTPAGDATLDFVAYPGEVLAWRLDAERARWETHVLDEATRSRLEGAPVSSLDVAASARPRLPGWLVHLRTTVGLVSARVRGPSASRTRSGAPAVDDAALRVKKRFAKLVARAESEGAEEAPELLTEARGLGESLVGRLLTRRELKAFVHPARESGLRLSARGDHERALRVLGLGLALLPGDPELMVAKGCALAARGGEADEALRALEAALERDRCLEASDVAKAMRARMELRGRLGRSVRV
ncbi:MAG: hypothetical protein JWP97_1906 [Labilithrix sp.]|nr:hypothetical protein [Labilithrix sp.]